MKSIEDLQHLVVSGFSDWQSLGHVVPRETNGLILFNYTIHAAIENRWNFFERISRGIILDKQTGEIVARPFDKFFNWHEKCSVPRPNQRNRRIVEVTEKMDGSLGLLYRNKGEYFIATRGSFSSDQALWATNYLHSGSTGLDFIPNECTLLFEVIYPENRIVVDYGNRKELVLLAARNRFTGVYYSGKFCDDISNKFGFGRPIDYSELSGSPDHILSHVGHWDSNHEGVVAVFDDGKGNLSRWKFKSAEYCRVHKIVSTLSFKNILKGVQDGSIDAVIPLIPEHFQEEVYGYLTEIQQTITHVKSMTYSMFMSAPKNDRKTFALWVKDNVPDWQTYMFALLDNKDITPIIFKNAFVDRLKVGGKLILDE
jgi:RNA ligase